MIERIRSAMTERGLDALLLTDERSRRYVTGFHSTDGLVYLSQKQAVFFTDFRYIEAARAEITDCEVREIGGGRSYAGVANELLREDGASCVGLEDDCLIYADYRRWEKNLKVQAVPQEGLLAGLRACKTSGEVEKIVAAQRIAERAFETILGELRPGLTEREVAARLTYLMLAGGAENMSFDPIVVTGANSSKPHGVPGDRVIARGDFVTMDFGCVVDGYCSDMTRTVAIGEVSDEMRRVYDTVLRAQLAGIAAARPGVTGAAVDGAARQVIEEAGYGDCFGHGFGHSVGLYIHELPSASPRSDAVLTEGVVLTAEPGIYLPGRFGVRIEDMLLLTGDGCENLTRADKQLIVL